MKSLIKLIGIYYFITGVILISLKMHDKTHAAKIGIEEYILSPLFLVVRLFIKTIDSNSFFIMFVIGILNILVVYLIQKYYLKSGFLLGILE